MLEKFFFTYFQSRKYYLASCYSIAEILNSARNWGKIWDLHRILFRNRNRASEREGFGSGRRQWQASFSYSGRRNKEEEKLTRAKKLPRPTAGLARNCIRAFGSRSKPKGQ
jgi:hypothetical protein